MIFSIPTVSLPVARNHHRRSARLIGAAAMTWAVLSARLYAQGGVPSLDDLAADWMQTSTLRSYPSIANCHGALKTDGNVLGFTSLAFPPYSQGGTAFTLSLDGKPLAVSKSRWYPYQVARQAVDSGLTVTSLTRMVFENQGVLMRVALQNGGPQPRPLKLGVDLTAFIRRYDGAWSWDIPRPAGEGPYQCTVVDSGKVCVTRDTSSAACTAYAFGTAPTSLTAAGSRGRAEWSMTIPGGGTQTIDIVMSAGGDANATATQARDWAGSFNSQFDQAKQLWEKRWQDAFTPNNGHFSGYAPTLWTPDAKLRRDYYMGVLDALLLERTNLPMAPRAYVTASPQWAVTLEYFWDTALWSSLFARLDPAMLKAHLEGFLSLDYHNCYARCMVSGKPAGPWYSANDLSLFTMAWDYLTITGDWDFLKDNIGGRTVLQHMDGIATHWKTLVHPNTVLADYGGAGNLLECVPTYINQVPSLNAANVWMMRRIADLHDRLGDAAQAAQYRTDAAKLETEVLKLYIPGQGVWNCRHADGKVVQLRHCYDYIIVGQSLGDDLTASMKAEMTGFVERELLVPGWMRAQSLNDPSASASDRPDHGPLGSYDGWPAWTAATMCGFGQYDKALSLLHQCEAVTHEGPFAQAHELIASGPETYMVRIANRGGQDYNEECGASFASEAILRGLFGCESSIRHAPLTVADPSTPRGFQGSLTGVRYQGAAYTVTSTAAGVTVSKQPAPSLRKLIRSAGFAPASPDWHSGILLLDDDRRGGGREKWLPVDGRAE